MAAYLTPAALAAMIGVDVLNDVADHNNDGDYDEAVVVDAIARAQGTVESFLDAYLPLNIPIRPEVLDAVAAIANERLRQSRDKGTDYSRQWYEDVMRWLKLVAEGKASLRGETDENSTEPMAPLMEANARVWSRSTGGRVF